PGNAERVLRRSLVGEQGWTIQPQHLRARKTDLDNLPFMDRDLIYANTAFRTRYKRTMMAGRGCPFRCTYCFEHAWNSMYAEANGGRVLQRHSVARLCAELKELKERWDTRYIKFYDDVFPVFDRTDDAWLEEFAEVYPREVGLPFHVLVRAELVREQNEKKLRLLKRAGIASISMSIESGNTFSRDYVLIRDMEEQDLEESFAICRHLGIPTFANTILGVPVPTLPNIYANEVEYEGQLAKILSVAAEVDPKRKRRTKQLSQSVAEAQASTTDHWERRRAVDRVLREAGVRATCIDYDKESVEKNVAWHVSFGEFPVFFPYQGTQLGEYAVRHGAFDGDYNKLHASYQTKSPLNCFTEHEKLQQQNLALLGTILLLFAGSTNPIMNWLAGPLTLLSTEILANLPFTDLYTRVYSLAKNYMHAARVYPMRYSPQERVRYLLDNLRLDVFKQLKQSSKKRSWRDIFRHRGDRQGQTLGGSPSI
ncbi:radical SAM protein, partial [Patescibacteria group bacterium]|nr:radical SAM protein [Patescibacteria group bacterium]